MRTFIRAACTFALLFTLLALPRAGIAQASGTEKTAEKPPLYIYIAYWAVPRAKWAEWAKPVPAEDKVLEQALADGTLVGSGQDFNLVHQAEDEITHDGWWASHSLAGILKTLDALENIPSTGGGASASTTKHFDQILVSHHYNWKAGTYKNAYEHGSSYKLKATAPDDALDTLSKQFFEPVLEKLLANGTIAEYEIDEEAIHTTSPDQFWVFYLAPTAEGLDKVSAAINDAAKANALLGPALDSLVDFLPHRDSLVHSTVTFK